MLATVLRMSACRAVGSVVLPRGAASCFDGERATRTLSGTGCTELVTALATARFRPMGVADRRLAVRLQRGLTMRASQRSERETTLNAGPTARRVHLALILLVGGLSAGCDVQTPIICTDMGCSSGVEVRLQEEPAPPYRVEADAGGGTATYVFECPAAGQCPVIFFPDFTPDRLIVRVVTVSDTTRYEVRPSYEESQPNGPGCDPICRRAVIELPADAIGHTGVTTDRGPRNR